MNSIGNPSGEQQAPLAVRMVELMRNAKVVRADETSEKVIAERKCKTGFIWTFRARVPQPPITSKFAMSRTDETPREVLGGTKGALVVDGCTGYNDVTDARTALDFILGLYRVEHDARDAGLRPLDVGHVVSRF